SAQDERAANHHVQHQIRRYLVQQTKRSNSRPASTTGSFRPTIQSDDHDRVQIRVCVRPSSGGLDTPWKASRQRFAISPRAMILKPPSQEAGGNNETTKRPDQG